MADGPGHRPEIYPRRDRGNAGRPPRGHYSGSTSTTTPWSVARLQDLVDALGGVTIDVQDESSSSFDTDITGAPPGRPWSSRPPAPRPLHALPARIRSQSHEFARMQRQRCLIAALVEQTSPVELLFNLGDISNAIKENVTTDIPQDALADFVALLPNLSTENFTTLSIDRSAYEIPAPNHLIRYFDVERCETPVTHERPEAARAALGLSGLDETCTETLDPNTVRGTATPIPWVA